MRVVVVAMDLSQIASRVAKKDRRFQHVWCAWDPAVRTSGALAFAVQVFDTEELVSQDHSASPTPPRFCGNRRFVSNDGSGKDDRTSSCGDAGETDGPNRR